MKNSGVLKSSSDRNMQRTTVSDESRAGPLLADSSDLQWASPLQRRWQPESAGTVTAST